MKIAVAEGRQDVSSHNTIDEMLALSLEALWALWPANISKKCGNIGWNTKQVLFDIVMKNHFWNMFHNTEKTDVVTESTTRLIRRHYHNGEVVDRSWLLVFSFTTCVTCFTCRLMSTDTTKCAHFLIRKGIFDWNHALLCDRGATSVQRDM